MDKNLVMNTAYNAGLITLGAVGTSMASKKLFRYDTAVSSTAQGVMKLALAVGGGALVVKYMQKAGYVPEEPWKDQ